MMRRNPWNREPSDEAVKEMAASIRDVGVLQPVTARPVPGEDGADLELVMGERRWAACMRISPDYEVPVIIRELDDKETAKLLAVENFQRHDLNPVEEARALAHMRESGWKVVEIAAAVGRNRGSVHRTLKILELPPEGLAAVADGMLAVQAAVKITALPADLQLRAIEDCVNPTTHARALGEREALAMLQERYVQPMMDREEWDKQRPAAENEWPTCEWTDYEEARSLAAAASGWRPVMERPEQWRRSKCYSGEVPTWLELARRHGATMRFGCVAGAPVPMVDVEPLVDAEKAAHAEHPAECVFEMASWEKEGNRAEMRREEVEGLKARQEKDEAVRKDFVRLCEDVLSGNMALSSMKVLCGWARDRLLDDYEEQLRDLYGLEGEGGVEELANELEMGDPDWATIGRLATMVEVMVLAPEAGVPPVRRLAALVEDLLAAKAIRKKDFEALVAEMEGGAL